MIKGGEFESRHRILDGSCIAFVWCKICWCLKRRQMGRKEVLHSTFICLSISPINLLILFMESIILTLARFHDCLFSVLDVQSKLESLSLKNIVAIYIFIRLKLPQSLLAENVKSRIFFSGFYSKSVASISAAQENLRLVFNLLGSRRVVFLSHLHLPGSYVMPVHYDT